MRTPTIAYPHTYTKPHFFTENYPAPSFSALSSYPSSCLHPAPRDNSLPFGRAGRQWRGQLWICSACYLMSVGMSLRACLLVPTSQASIHVESEQSIKQLADSSARVFFLLLSSLSSSLSLSLCLFLSIFLSASIQHVPPSISNHKQAQVYFASTPLLASPSPDIMT